MFWKENKQDSIGHISPKAFLLLLSKKNFEKRVQLFLKMSTSKEEVSAFNKKIKKLISRDKELEICKISSSQIKDIINFYDIVGRNVKSQKNVLRGKISSFVTALDLKSKEITELLDDEKKMISRDFEKYKKVKDFMLDAPINSLFLWLLSVITFPHFNYTRYPGNKDFSYKNYNLSLGIVHCQENLLKIIERRLLKRLNNIVNMDESMIKKERSQ